jgi:hypothetical protein
LLSIKIGSEEGRAAPDSTVLTPAGAILSDFSTECAFDGDDGDEDGTYSLSLFEELVSFLLEQDVGGARMSE